MTKLTSCQIRLQEIRERNTDLGYTLINANKMYFDRSLPLGQCMQVSGRAGRVGSVGGRVDAHGMQLSAYYELMPFFIILWDRINWGSSSSQTDQTRM